jgi:hypothetical protein
VRTSLGAVILLGLALGGCGSSGTSGSGGLGNLFGSSAAESPGDTAAGASSLVAAAANDTPCPDIEVRSGASTLMVSNNPGAGEPNPLDVRYQGTFVRLARECHVNAGMLNIKVGVEGRVVTGPAGVPGTVNVPLRIAVVQDAIEQKTLVSHFATIPVTVSNAVDRVTFTHIDSEISFPAPKPIERVDTYVIYVGFDPLGAQQPRKPARGQRAPRARS